MKIVSWNVNGIRSAIQKGFVQYLDEEKPDVVCLQEIKASREQAGLLLFEYPYQFWNSGERKGYSGTAVFSRIKPLAVTCGIGVSRADVAHTLNDEGRVITAEFDDFFIVNVYVPNSQRSLGRFEHRLRWNELFHDYILSLEKKKPVIVAGDMNVAHTELDLANPKQNVGNAGFTQEERDAMTKLLDAGYVDSLREFHHDGGLYTWWGFAFDSRARNIGWRFDYVCVSKRLRSRLKTAFIHKHVLGSDHCPIGIVLD